MNAAGLLTRTGRDLVAPVCLAMTLIFFGLTTEGVLDGQNILNVGGQAAPLAILALGQLVVILTRGFDISVGSVVALSAVCTAWAINEVGTAGIIAGPLAGLLCGLINGVAIGRFRVPPIVATLGMLSAARGLAILASDERGVTIEGSNPLASLGYGEIAGIPTGLIVLMVATLILTIVLRRSHIGRRVYMVGSNERGARLSGVNVSSTLVFSYAVSGLSAGVAALFFVGRAGAGLPTEGNGLELQAIAAVVVGGGALTGAVGRPVFVLVGALFIQFLGNGLNLAGTSPFEQEIVLGIVLLAAGLLDFTIRYVASSATSQKGTP